MTVIEVDNRYREEILFILMIVGPLFLLTLLAVLALVMYQKNGFKQDAAD